MPCPPVVRRLTAPALVAFLLATAGICSPALVAPAAAQGTVALTPAEQSRRDGGIPPFTEADVAFMQGMIGHHAQAVVMGRWAAAHGASAELVRLAERIVVSQTDEIHFMQAWLRTRKQEAPDPLNAEAPAGGHAHHEHGVLMPGMLTPEQMADLDAARGPVFDRKFLVYMIRHHQGAIGMVRQLFASTGAAQDDDIFKFASDVEADQTSEVDRMFTMLEARERAGRTP